jgi:hypothetical protein
VRSITSLASLFDAEALVASRAEQTTAIKIADFFMT